MTRHLYYTGNTACEITASSVFLNFLKLCPYDKANGTHAHAVSLSKINRSVALAAAYRSLLDDAVDIHQRGEAGEVVAEALHAIVGHEPEDAAFTRPLPAE